MPAPTLAEHNSRLYMVEIDIELRLMTLRELNRFRKDSPEEYRQWLGWQVRGCPGEKMVGE
jgi:hypothetical protein